MNPAYCACCYDQAKKHGRPVRVTDVYEYQICSLCESRIRNGLVKYQPSNGTEFDIFQEGCERCRHYDKSVLGEGDFSRKACAHGILDKLLDGMFSESDSMKFWFDPQDLTTRDANGKYICPAQCLRFTGKNDPDGERRDPPKPDCEGQLFFSDILVVKEKSPLQPQETK